MGGIVLEEDECNSRLEYLGRLLAVQNLELDSELVSERDLIAWKENNAAAITLQRGMVKLMKDKAQRYEKKLHAAVNLQKGSVKLDVTRDLLHQAQHRLKKLQVKQVRLEEALNVEHQRLGKMRLQARALQEKHAYLGCASGGFHLRPLPLVYVAREASTGEKELCALCVFPFPHSEMIVTACRHLYHPCLQCVTSPPARNASALS